MKAVLLKNKIAKEREREEKERMEKTKKTRAPDSKYGGNKTGYSDITDMGE